MDLTLDQLLAYRNALKRMLYAGVLSMSFSGATGSRQTTFRSQTDLLQALSLVEADIAAAVADVNADPPVTQIRLLSSKGL